MNKKSIELEYEVPGSPEEVWRAIATGPGISSWFVPTEVEEHVGGKLTFHMGPGMDGSGVVTRWDAPHAFAYEEPEWSPGAPPLASEFYVEAKSGDSCVVRLVHSFFADSSQWDDQLESFKDGWPPFFTVLRLYMTHFRNQPSATLRSMGNSTSTQEEAWSSMKSMLSLTGVKIGDHRENADPKFAGIVEQVNAAGHQQEITLRIDQPSPGVAQFGVFAWGDKVHAVASLFLYGDSAAQAAEEARPIWAAWMNEHFPTQAGDADAS